jgi:Rieske 2Fe-2S family protein
MRPVPVSPISAEEVAATRRPLLEAHTLPARVYHDPAVFAFEVEAWLRKEWLFVCREEDLPEAGSYIRQEILGDSIIIVRGNDGAIRAFYNVCRHRGSMIVQEPAGKVGGFSCPYHAWTYDLQGRLRQPKHTDELVNFSCEANGLLSVFVRTWAGCVFINLDPDPKSFDEHLGDFPRHFDRFNLHELRRAERMEYDVKANWKALVENYSECYHCPGVHPLLNHITPANLGGGISLTGSGQWSGGSMVMTSDYETLSTDGYLHGRPVMPSMTEQDLKHVYYCWIWPNMLFSLHPDFLMTHQVWPVDAGRSIVICELFFHPTAMERTDFDPSGPAEFWDITNREDWHVCELQQLGTKMRAYTPGRYAANEGMVHEFDITVADRYAGDGVTTLTPRRQRATGAYQRSAAGEMASVTRDA